MASIYHVDGSAFFPKLNECSAKLAAHIVLQVREQSKRTDSPRRILLICKPGEADTMVDALELESKKFPEMNLNVFSIFSSR